MTNELNLRLWKWVPWAICLFLWGGIIYISYAIPSGIYKNFHVLNRQPWRYLNVVIAIAGMWVAPHQYGNMVTRIRKEGEYLIFSTAGRIPFVPWGPQATDFRVHALSTFEWSRPHFYVSCPDGSQWQFNLSLARASRLKNWFSDIGLPDPKGL